MATTVPMSIDSFWNGRLKEMSKAYEVVTLSSPGSELEIISKREGVKTLTVPMERHISLFKDIKAFVSVFKVIRMEKPDMIHSMTLKAGLLCMISGWLLRVPIRIHTFVGLFWPTAKGIVRRVVMMTDSITCACATNVIPEGKGVMDDMIAGGITKKPMKVLGYGNVRGVDMKYYDRTDEVMTAASKIKKDGVFTFVFVGRIVGDKGINELVSAFKRLHDKYERTRLLLIGPYESNLDPISEITKKIIAQMDSIEAVGQQADVRAWYAASDCFVFPSYREGFPNTVLEAGALGLPSIVTDINGSREIIIEGENGVIVPARDADALYDAMEMMLTDEQRRLEMAGKARQLIETRYEKSFVCKCQLDFYKELFDQLGK